MHETRVKFDQSLVKELGTTLSGRSNILTWFGEGGFCGTLGIFSVLCWDWPNRMASRIGKEADEFHCELKCKRFRSGELVEEQFFFG